MSVPSCIKGCPGKKKDDTRQRDRETLEGDIDRERKRREGRKEKNTWKVKDRKNG